jgi:hypothetical protein
VVFVDSWYLYHAYLNVARLGQYGDKVARRLFLESLEYGIRIARHFNYRWPILYDLYTREVVRPKRAPNKGGEDDVGAQYVHVMQQAYEMTKDKRYVNEAENAAQALAGLGFDLGYQYNNTGFGAGALMWLWQQTGKELYRELSHVCMAAIAQNFWLWECKYGYAKSYQTFMGLPPLRHAPYLALYEELELLAAFHEYFGVAKKDAMPCLRVLLPEYCKYLVDRAWYHYPSELPKEALADTCKTGILDRNLSVPIEDIYEGWEKAGQVGQQVYGTAAPFVFATRHDHVVPGEDFVVNCSYPVRDYAVKKAGAHRGVMRFQAEGDSRCTCHVRVIATKYKPLPKITVRRDGLRKAVKGTLTSFGYLEYEIPGDAAVKVEWKVEAVRVAKPRMPKRARGEGNRRLVPHVHDGHRGNGQDKANERS